MQKRRQRKKQSQWQNWMQKRSNCELLDELGERVVIASATPR